MADRKLSDTEKELLEKYKEIGLGSCDICRKCRDEYSRKNDGKALSNPVGAWVVGKDFDDPSLDRRVLFVGKNARNENNDLSFTFSNAQGLWSQSWPYWRYTREVVKKVYGDDSIEHIAFTNLVKCDDSDGIDTTDDFTKQCCICELGVIVKEIEIIRPTHIIFYTHTYYDDYLKKIFDFCQEPDWDCPEKIGARNMPWTEAEASLHGSTETFKILRVGHPQCKKKIDFVDKISQWIIDN